MVAFHPIGRSSIDQRSGKARVEPNRLVEIGQCAVMVTLTDQREAALVVSERSRETAEICRLLKQTGDAQGPPSRQFGSWSVAAKGWFKIAAGRLLHCAKMRRRGLVDNFLSRNPKPAN